MRTIARLRFRTELVVTPDCLDTEFPVEIAGVTGRLRTPRFGARVPDGERLGPNQDPWRPPLEGWNCPPRFGSWAGEIDDDGSWGTSVLGATSTYGGVTACLLELDTTEDLSQPNSGAASLHLAADDWIDLLRLWAGAAYKQYTSPLPRLDGGRNPGDSLHLWVEVGDEIRLTPRPPTELVIGQAMHVLDLDDFRALLDHASDGVPPPPEWSLLADARNHLARREHRTAVVDAATAAEIALSDHLVKALSVVNADLARRVVDHATLGRLVEYAGVQSAPVPVTHGLVRVRNGVVHRGETPTSEAAATAVAIAEALVEHLAPPPS